MKGNKQVVALLNHVEGWNLKSLYNVEMDNIKSLHFYMIIRKALFKIDTSLVFLYLSHFGNVFYYFSTGFPATETRLMQYLDPFLSGKL